MELDSLAALNFLAIHEQWWDHCSASIHDCHISVHQLDYWIRERFQILTNTKISADVSFTKKLRMYVGIKWNEFISKLDWFNSTLILPISKRNHICVKKRRVVYLRLMTSTYRRGDKSPKIILAHISLVYLALSIRSGTDPLVSKQGIELERIIVVIKWWSKKNHSGPSFIFQLTRLLFWLRRLSIRQQYYFINCEQMGLKIWLGWK